MPLADVTLPPALAARLTEIVGPRRVLVRRGQLLSYSADGLPGYTRVPGLAVFPGTRDETVAVVRELAKDGVPFVPRGAGTGLSGGALADGVVLLGLNRLRRIISVDPVNQVAVVEPGVVNSVLSREVAAHGLHYAPDPSSQAACTIGGNVAENAGGPHCLKYGVTLNHVVAITAVLPDGEVHTCGNAAGEHAGYDLVGAFVGSEGCFGVALDVTVRLQRNPQAIRTLLADFMSIDSAARAVSAIIARGILPAALEMMDSATIRAVEASIYAAGYPVDAAAVLLIELDGFEAAGGLDDDVATVVALCNQAGARSVRVATDDAERAKLWQGRKKAFGAMGRVSPHLVVQDAVVPRTKLPAVLEEIHAISTRYRVKVCNVFHAGDGNLHPNIGYDAHDPDESERVHHAMREIMELCIAAGGSITGEHGVGMDKLRYMDQLFSAATLRAMCDLRDVFDPHRRSNPGKVVPVHSCREWTMAASARDGWTAPPTNGREELTPSRVHPIGDKTAMIAEQVRDASAAGRPLRIVGAGTWLDAGCPVRAEAVLSLAADRGIVEYVPGDLTLTARAGTPLADLVAAVKAHDQWLPLDPWGGDAGTLGATVSTATAGPHAFSTGLPRDVVLGLEFVSGSGDVIRGGGRVVKNVAGFDLTRLLIGSWGTLGVITEVTVRLRARPDRTRTLALDVAPSAQQLNELAVTLRALPFTPLACELVNAALAVRLGIGDRATLLVRLGGNQKSLASQADLLGRVGAMRDVPADIWQRLRESIPPTAWSWRFSQLPSRFGDTWTTADRGVRVLERALIHGNPARGVARIAAEGEGPRLARAACDFSGTTVIESLPPDGWRAATPVQRNRLCAAIREKFDPRRILNPGIMNRPGGWGDA